MKTTVFVLAMILSVDMALSQSRPQSQREQPQPQQRGRRTNGQPPAGQPDNRGNLPEIPAPGQKPTPAQTAEKQKWEALLALLTPDQVRNLWPGKDQDRDPGLHFVKLANSYAGIGGKSTEADAYIQAVTKAVIVEPVGASNVLLQSSITNTFERFKADESLFASAELQLEKWEILVGIINRYTEMIKPKIGDIKVSDPGEATLEEATKYVLNNLIKNDEAKVNAIIAELKSKKALFSLRESVAPRQIGEKFNVEGIRARANTRTRGNI